MNRPRIVSTAHVVLIALVGFALVYGLPLLGLNFAIDHGLYVAASVAAASSLRLEVAEGVRESAYPLFRGSPEKPLSSDLAGSRKKGVHTTHTLLVTPPKSPLASQVVGSNNLGGAA